MSHRVGKTSHPGLLAFAGVVVSAWMLIAPAGAQEPLLQPGESILVLHGGQLVRGKVSRSGTGYSVERGTGRMFVPAPQVRFQAKDLEDAYQQQRLALPPRDAAARVELAKWCVTVKLLPAARDELRAALELDPEQEEIRKLLQRVNDLLKPRPAEPERPEPKPRLRLNEILYQEQAESLGGLSRESATAFSARVQPILMNNCAMASCHGPAAKNEFRLRIVRGDASRLLIEENLAMVMKYVDKAHPLESALVKAPQGLHGVKNRPIFLGARGTQQLEELQAWLASLAPEEEEPAVTVTGKPRKSSSARAKAPSHYQSPLAQAVAVMQENRSQSASRTITTAAGEPIAELLPAEEQAEAEAVLSAEPDPFDPEIFNRETRRRQRGF